MTDFYLITGFLGAGKTSLLKSLLPLFTGRKIRLIINEFGKVGLDGALMRAAGADAKEIVNGSIFCVCRLDQFEQALQEAAADAPDAIFVETSGLSDPGAVRTVLAPYERAGALRYRGAVCLVDAPRFQKIVETARACKKQLAVADLVLINKTDMVSKTELEAVEHLLKGICLAPSIRTNFGAITREQLEQLSPVDRTEAMDLRPDLTLQKETLLIAPACTVNQIRRMLSILAEDTYRIKGFVSGCDGTFLVDCVGSEIWLTPYQAQIDHENQLTLLAGEGMPLRSAIRSLMSEYDSLVTWQKG